MAQSIVKLAIGLICAVGPGCESGRARPLDSAGETYVARVSVPRVRLVGPVPGSGPRWRPGAIAERLAAAFDADPGWIVDGEGADFAGVVEVSFEAVDPSGPVVQIDGELWSRRSELPIPIAYVGRWPCRLEGAETVCDPEVESRFVSGLSAVLDVARGGEAEVRAALGSTDRAVVLAGARAAQQHRDAGLYEALLVGLDPDDPELLLATIGALAQAGDQRAVVPIIDAIDLSDVELLLTVIPPIARLGGPDSIGFLESVAAGHDSARARVLARDFVGSAQ